MPKARSSSIASSRKYAVAPQTYSHGGNGITQSDLQWAVEESYLRVWNFYLDECMKRGDDNAVYRMYDLDDQLLYIGISADPGTRFGDHLKTKPWFAEVANIRVEHHLNRESARRREGLMAGITKYNKVRPDPFFDAEDIKELFVNLCQLGIWVPWPYDVYNPECVHARSHDLDPPPLADQTYPEEAVA